MKIATVKKQPNEKRRWAINYEDALDDLDQIISVGVNVEPAGLTASATGTGGEVRVVCQGGTDGVTYKVTLTVTTTDTNEIIEDELFVKVKEI